MIKASISHAQYGLLVVAITLIAALLQYTTFVYLVGARGWWITVVADVALALALSYPLAALMNRFPGKTLIGISRELHGKIFGWLLPIPVLVMGGAFTTLFILRGFDELFARTLLPKTPESIIFAVALFTVAYVASLGPAGIGRLVELGFYLIELPLVVPIFAMALAGINFHYLQPLLWWPKGLPFSKDFLSSLTFFLGAPTILVFAPYLQQQGRAYRPIFRAGVAALPALIAITMIPLGILGPETAGRLSLPMVFAFSTLHATVLFVQQLSYLIVALWSVFFFVGGAATLWFCARGCAELVRFGTEAQWAWGLAVALYITGVHLLPFATYMDLLQIWAPATAAIYGWIVLLYWPLTWWKQRKGGNKSAHA